MAQDPNQNFVTGAGYPIIKQVIAKAVRSVNFAVNAAAPLLAELTPVTATTPGDWVVWEKGAQIDGFVFTQDPVGLQLSATNKVLGNILWAGTIRRSELPTAVSIDAAAVEADLDAALLLAASDMRKRDYTIQGLPNFR